MKTIIEAPGNLIKYYCVDNSFIFVESKNLIQHNQPDYRSGILDTRDIRRFVKQPKIILNLTIARSKLRVRWPFTAPELFEPFYPDVLIIPLIVYTESSTTDFLSLLNNLRKIFGNSEDLKFGILIDSKDTPKEINSFLTNASIILDISDMISFIMLDSKLDGLIKRGRFLLAKEIRNKYPEIIFLFKELWRGIDDFIDAGANFQSSNDYFIGTYPVKLGLSGLSLNEWQGIKIPLNMNNEKDRLKLWTHKNIQEFRAKLNGING